MKLHILLGHILIAVACVGCAILQSSLEYTKGTECLESGDYRGAVLHLEKACELDPNMSRNHNNLAVAYMRLGNVGRAWYHSRQAVLIDVGNCEAVCSFNQLAAAIFKECDIRPGSLTEDQAIDVLGVPDTAMDFGNRKVFFYGTIKLEFVDGTCEKVSGL